MFRAGQIIIIAILSLYRMSVGCRPIIGSLSKANTQVSILFIVSFIHAYTPILTPTVRYLYTSLKLIAHLEVGRAKQKRVIGQMRTAKAQISLHIRAV